MSVALVIVLSMSDYVATLVVDEQQFVLMDYDRPVWFQKDAKSGIRILPTKDHLLADALAAFVLGSFDGFAEANRGIVDVDKIEQDVNLDDVRDVVYRMDTSAVELLLPEATQPEFHEHLKKFVTAIKVTIEDPAH